MTYSNSIAPYLCLPILAEATDKAILLPCRIVMMRLVAFVWTQLKRSDECGLYFGLRFSHSGIVCSAGGCSTIFILPNRRGGGAFGGVFLRIPLT